MYYQLVSIFQETEPSNNNETNTEEPNDVSNLFYLLPHRIFHSLNAPCFFPFDSTQIHSFFIYICYSKKNLMNLVASAEK